MRFLREIELRFRQYRDRHYSVLSLDRDLSAIGLDNLKSNVGYDSKETSLSKMGEAVYSTYCGSSKNKTLINIRISSDIPHYFVSNNDDILFEAEALGWKAIKLELPVFENRVLSAFQAKIAKAVPHIFSELNKHRYLMYADDKLYFDPKLIGGIIEQQGGSGFSLLLREHNFLHGNILQEFAEALGQKRYRVLRDRMIKFINEQVSGGLRLDRDKLFWTSAILRNNYHPDTIKINEEWYLSILKCGINCQLSFNFLAQKYDSIATMPDQTLIN